MHKFELPKEVYERVRVAAEAQGVSVERFMLDAIYEAIEDFEDVRAAEAALKRIADGEDEVISAEEFWRGLDHQIPQIDTEKRRKA